jgi:poly(ADP-ribose) glycohydrolase ARH3
MSGIPPDGWLTTGLDARAAAELGVRVPFPEVTEPAAGRTPGRDRFRGALLGGAIGDALGRPFEGSRRPADEPPTFFLANSWRDGRNEGTWTDDTQLTVVVGEALLAGRGRVEPADVVTRLVAWLPIGRGVGRATRRAVENLEAGVAWNLAGEPSAGNGAAMRVAPIGLVHAARPAELALATAAATVPTHADPTALVGALAMAWLTGRCAETDADELDPEDLVRELQGALAEVHDPPVEERRPGGQTVRLLDRLSEVAGLLGLPPERAFARLHNGAFVLESLPAALWCFLAHLDDPEAAVGVAAAGGFDADTVAAMAGTLVGALHGEDAWAPRWTDALERADDLVSLADRLHDLGTELPTEPPPRECPACGAMTLVSIVYGMPGHELFEAAERGEVVLGGCIVDWDQPTAACTACGGQW